MDRIKIVKDADEFFLPPRLVIMDDQLKVRSNPGSRVFAHGASDVADGKIAQKILRIEGVVDHLGPERTVFFNQVQLIRQKMLQTDYKLYLGDSYYINVNKVLQIKDDYLESDNYNASRLTIDLLCLDPFWYSDDEQEKTETITATPTSFVVNNVGRVETFPVITITATGALPDFVLENETDVQSDGDGLKFRYTDPGLFAGDVLVIDCVEGTVKRGATNYIRYFTGAFLKLLAGDNTLTYTGADCSIKVEWFERSF